MSWKEAMFDANGRCYNGNRVCVSYSSIGGHHDDDVSVWPGVRGQHR